MSVRPAAGGGRYVDVDPARLPGWLNGFAGRHGAYHVTDISDGVLHILAADGSAVTLPPPPGASPSSDVESFVQEALRERRIGLLLARQSSAAIGVADGPRLVTSKVQTAYVQSRTDELSTVVTGGDRRTVEAILADRRLAPIAPLRSDRFLDVREPRLAVLEKAIASARAVRLLVEDPDPSHGGDA